MNSYLLRIKWFSGQSSYHRATVSTRSSARVLQILLRLALGIVRPVILTLDLLDKLLHLLDLAIPLILGHLCLATEQLLVGLAVAAAQSVPQGRELAVVEVEVEMVHRVAGGAVDDGAVVDVLAVVDDDGPDVDQHEEQDVRVLVQREDEREDVVWQTLGPAVERMEGVRGVGSRHDPLVVWLVQALVNHGVMQAAVDPVDEEIGEHEEERELEYVVQRKRRVANSVVHVSVAADFEEEKGNGGGGHARHGLHCLSDLHAHLVLEVFRVVEVGFVKDEVVGEGSKDEVDEESEDPIKKVSTESISDLEGCHHTR